MKYIENAKETVHLGGLKVWFLCRKMTEKSKTKSFIEGLSDDFVRKVRGLLDFDEDLFTTQIKLPVIYFKSKEDIGLGWAPTKRKSDNLSLLSHFCRFFRHRQKTTKRKWKSDRLSLFCRFFCRFFRFFKSYLWFPVVENLHFKKYFFGFLNRNSYSGLFVNYSEVLLVSYRYDKKFLQKIELTFNLEWTFLFFNQFYKTRQSDMQFQRIKRKELNSKYWLIACFVDLLDFFLGSWVQLSKKGWSSTLKQILNPFEFF